ncbi:MAG: exonuclease SbcCD subunit D [Muribaculaceae bacterium]|nr:exonuclease SbcCD subunit D [Muribaculaceae bacterium]
MKILHTSDWHIGQILHNIDRADDHREMLGCIRDLVAEHQPDLLLVCGDIFHTSQPSASAQKLLTDALIDIRRAAPQMTIVLTAGNHDSASRHETHSAVWELSDIHTIGTIDPDAPGANIIEIPGKGWLAAVPYVNERNMPAGYYGDILDSISSRNAEGLPVIMCAHTTVRGSDFSGHADVSDFYVGGIDYRDLDEMGSGYDYLALGHIHRPQTIRGSHGRARYCGTPLPVSFDERYPHSVSLVTIEAHGSVPLIEELPVREKRLLINIPPEGCAPWDECIAGLQRLDGEIEAYIRMNVEVETVLPPGAFREAESELSCKKARLAYINSIRKEKETKDRSHLSVSEFRKMRPIEIAEKYCSDVGIVFSDELRRLFTEAETAALSDSQN